MPTPDCCSSLTSSVSGLTPLASLAVPVRLICQRSSAFFTGLMVVGGTVTLTTGATVSTTRLSGALAAPTLLTMSVARTRRLIAPLCPASEKAQALAPDAGCQAPLLMLTSTRPTPEVASPAVPPMT